MAPGFEPVPARPLVLTHGALLSLEAWALLWQPLLAAGAPADTTAHLASQVLISTPPQGIGDSLQNRLLAPIGLSGRSRGAAPTPLGHAVYPYAVRLAP